MILPGGINLNRLYESVNTWLRETGLSAGLLSEDILKRD